MAKVSWGNIFTNFVIYREYPFQRILFDSLQSKLLLSLLLPLVVVVVEVVSFCKHVYFCSQKKVLCTTFVKCIFTANNCTYLLTVVVAVVVVVVVVAEVVVVVVVSILSSFYYYPSLLLLLLLL